MELLNLEAGLDSKFEHLHFVKYVSVFSSNAASSPSPEGSEQKIAQISQEKLDGRIQDTLSDSAAIGWIRLQHHTSFLILLFSPLDHPAESLLHNITVEKAMNSLSHNVQVEAILREVVK